MAGVRPVLFVTLAFVLAHNVLYTYVAPFLAAAKMAERTNMVLLVFGPTSLVSIWIVGVLIERRLRELTLASIVLFGLTALALDIWSDVPAAIYIAAGSWGLAFGGAATLFQTALAKPQPRRPMSQSMLVTAWNAAIAGGGIMAGCCLKESVPSLSLQPCSACSSRPSS